MLARFSLRARLVIGAVLLCAIGLAIANVATYASLRSFVLQRTDQSLEESHFGIGRSVVEHGCPTGGDGPIQGASPGDFVQVRSASGEVQCSLQVPQRGAGAASPPKLPATITLPDAEGPERVRYFTTDARDGGHRYRVRASVEQGSDSILIIATSLTDVDATLRRLLLIELLVTAAVLAALAALGLWVVRLGLRPLAEIEKTAAAIAGGDLSRRVDRAESQTEVGRLGMALNAMLAQIEAAFKAQAASEQKLRRFVADASHELRTPLSAVRAYSELFERGAGERPEDLARSMAGIERESERMSLLVEDLLLLARLDEGRPLSSESVELEDVVKEAVETARMVEPDRPIEAVVKPATVLGDRHRLRQVVDNLLSNVRAHTPTGAPVRVRLAREDGSAVLEVEDAGPGLTPEDRGRVFERFYRADESRSRESGGVGLGLSIVAAVAKAHGGTVEASSEPGTGALFRITLPLAKVEPGD